MFLDPVPVDQTAEPDGIEARPSLGGVCLMTVPLIMMCRRDADELARPFDSVRIMTAGATAAAAAARRRRQQQEEEEMTVYTPQELAEGWEFKIVRSATGAFKRSAFLRAVLDEEQRAGWTFVEKFDNGRIRLKRPASARANDSALGSDAYRSHVGMSELKFTLCLIAAIVGGLAVVLLTISMIVKAR
jgi:hypothetical protein